MDKIKKIMNLFNSAFFPSGAEEAHEDYAKAVIKNTVKIIKALQKKDKEQKIKKIMNIFSSAFYPAGADEVHENYAKAVVKNTSVIIKTLQKNENLKEEILNTTFSLTEMALKDLSGIDIEKDSEKDIALAYVKNARGRDMNDKQILSGVGATFRTMVDQEKAWGLKDEIKKLLELEDTKPKKKKLKISAVVTKKAKEDTVYKGTEKVRAAAKRAAEVMKENIINRSNLIEKNCDAEKKNKDIYMSQQTDELSCKYCKERYDTEEALDKHQKTCMA